MKLLLNCILCICLSLYKSSKESQTKLSHLIMPIIFYLNKFETTFLNLSDLKLINLFPCAV